MALVGRHVAANEFASEFPVGCADNEANVIGTNQQQLALAFEDQVADAGWPLQAARVPEPAVVMDIVEFCATGVARATQRDGSWHPYFGHHHLDFDAAAGRREFVADVNNWFGRHGLAYEVRPDGQVRRLSPTVVRERLVAVEFDTGDPILVAFLERARTKYSKPSIGDRLDALKELWDAWERLKSQAIPGQKKKSTEQLLAQAAGDHPSF